MSMFNAEQLEKTIDIKDRSYKFLRLLQNKKLSLKGEYYHIRFQEIELSNFKIFKNIILANYFVLPKESRPVTTNDRDVDGFCNFFLSYLFSSFEYSSKPRLAGSAEGCLCPLCAHLTSAPYLKLKKVTNWDKRNANVLQREVVGELASSAGLSLTDEQEEELLRNEFLVEPLALVAYGVELIRRCEGERSDPSSLVLWRRFAWNKAGSPKKSFILRVEMILDADKVLESRIREIGITDAV